MEKEFDVIVIGGGTSGSISAIASAREGAKTLIVEQFGSLGGSATLALVTPLMRYNEDFRVGGISDEINEKLAKLGFSYENWFDPEMLKFVLEDMAITSGVSILYYSFFSDVILKDNRIKGIKVVNKSGEMIFYGKTFIDATGDADVAFKCGVPIMAGDEEGINQAMSLRFILGGVDMERLAEFLNSLGVEPPQKPPLIEGAMVWGKGFKLEPIFRKAVEEGVLERKDGDYFQFFSIPGKKGFLAFNCPRISEKTKGYNVEDLTFAQVEGKKAILRLWNFCKRYLPGCEDSFIVHTAEMVGVRESRRIIGEYILTLDDILNAKKFEDGIAFNAYPVDVHSPKEQNKLKTVKLPKGDYYEIPYRCLLPKKIENLIVTGRCISAEFEVQASLRIQVVCRVLGEASGIAAAWSSKRNCSPKEIDGRELRKYLKEKGIKLPS